MRLVTYDRDGARRLGAWVEDAVVVDLPEAVGHPVFPTTMEALVARGGGTTLEAARDALSRPDHWEGCVVPRPRLLVPVLPPPGPDRPGGPGAGEGPPCPAVPVLLGPEDELPEPWAGRALEAEVDLVAVLGGSGAGPGAGEEAPVFGYSLAIVWSAGTGPGGPLGATVGPAVATADGFQPGSARLTVAVNGEPRLRRSARAAPRPVARLSRCRELRPGDLVRVGPGAGTGLRVLPGDTVEAEAEGIGLLRVRLPHSGPAALSRSAPAPGPTTWRTPRPPRPPGPPRGAAAGRPRP